MANRGRDLKISILSDLDKFETDPAAKELERLGESAKDTGEDIDRTAKKVDDAFDKIARSSRSNLRQVDDDARNAGKGMDDFKSEVDQVGREASTSFTGDMEDISDALRDVSANALAAFGPAGAFVGIAAAAGVGMVVSALQDAADKANELKENTADFAGEIVDAGGDIDDVDLTGKFQDWSLAIKDNKDWWEVWQKEAVTNLEAVQAAAEKAGVEGSDMLAALSGGDSQDAIKTYDELKRKSADLKDEIDAITRSQSGMADVTDNARSNLVAQKDATDELITTFDEYVKQQQDAIDMAEAIAEANGYTTAQLERQQDAYSSLDDALDGHAMAAEEAARREAVANGDSAANWKEYADTAVASLDDINVAMQRQIEAVTDYNANQQEVLNEMGEEGLSAARYIADEFGITIQDAMQMLADAPKEKQGEFVSNMNTMGRLGGDSYVEESARAANEADTIFVEQAGQTARTLGTILGKEITVPVKVGSASNTGTIRRNIIRDLSGITVGVRVAGVVARRIV